MKVAVTGGTGLVGHGLVGGLLSAGHQVVSLGRHPSAHPAAGHLPFDLGEAPPDLGGFDALVNAAFAHVPGRYRGGEGTDPEGFRRLNLDGSLRLFAAARDAGVRRVVFISSRAVYGDYHGGTALHEDLEPRPDTLYGQLKLEAERGLAGMASPGMIAASLRATGVYGPPVPGRAHKWQQLFDGFGRGETIRPAIGTEVHAADFALAVRLLLETPPDRLAHRIYNVSDFVLDRRDLLSVFSRISGVKGSLPIRSDANAVNAMSTDRIRQIGWRTMGEAALASVVADLLRDAGG